MTSLGEQGLSSTYVTSIYRVVARIFAMAAADGVIPRDPCQRVRPPRQRGHTEQHFLDSSEVVRLAKVIEPRYQALIYTAAYTGLRWGELAGLTRSRLDLAAGTLAVVQALTETNGYVEVGPSRTGRARTVGIPLALSQLLAEHLVRFPSDGPYVFSSAQGQPLRRNFYRRHFKPAVLRAGLHPDLRFHDLRHSAAAMLVALDAHPKEVQHRLGHSSIQVTLDRYGHLFPSLDARAADRLEIAWRAEGVGGTDSRQPSAEEGVRKLEDPEQRSA